MAPPADGSGSGNQNTTQSLLPPSPPPAFDVLPGELRTMIYEYLLHAGMVEENPLDHAATRVDRPNSNFGLRYRFHTSILAVNRQFGAEAAICLYSKKNPFVLITLTGPEITSLCNIHDLPGVSAKRFNAIERYFFSINIEWHAGFGTIRFLGDASTKRQKFTMLLKDIPALSRMLSLQCQYMVPPSVYMYSKTGSGLVLRSAQRVESEPGPPRIEVSARSGVSSECIGELLSALSLADGCGYNMDLSGLEPQLTVLEDLYCIAPRLVQLQPWIWDRLGSWLDLKRSADNLLMRGLELAALERYLYTFELVTSKALSRMWSNLDTPNSIESRSCFLRRRHLLFDIVLTVASLSLRAGCTKRALHALEWFKRTTRISDLPPLMEGDVHHVALLSTAMGCSEKGQLTAHNAQVLECLLNGSVTSWHRIFQGERVHEDWAVIGRAMKKSKVEGSNSTLAVESNMLSVIRYPVAVRDNQHDFSGLPGRPRRAVFKLTDEEKEQICKFQKEHGLPVSRFK